MLTIKSLFIKLVKNKIMLLRIIIIFWGLLSFSQVFAQINQDTTQNNTTNVTADSLLIKNQIVSDSIALRQNFINDSLIAREIFVKDYDRI